LPERTVPLDEHDTSYFADSASIRSFSIVFSVSIALAKLRKNKGRTKRIPLFLRILRFFITFAADY